MDFKKAEEILNSPENIEVLYNGQPVWIHNLNQQNKTAEVTYVQKPFEKLEVPVNELEKGNESGLQ